MAERVRALLDQLSVDEKIGQLDATTHPTGAVERLGVPAFQGWNGALGQGSSVIYWPRYSRGRTCCKVLPNIKGT